MFYLRHLKSVRSGKTPFLLKSVLSLTILLLTVVVLQSMLKASQSGIKIKVRHLRILRFQAAVSASRNL